MLGHETHLQRSTDMLYGHLKGISLDDELNNDEIGKLHGWLESHESLCGQWPFSEIKERLDVILSDDVVDEDEREEGQTDADQGVDGHAGDHGRFVPDDFCTGFQVNKTDRKRKPALQTCSLAQVNMGRQFEANIETESDATDRKEEHYHSEGVITV